MKKKNNLVRHIDASETMGQATNICSDKTGTLTQNVMTVVSMSVGLGAPMESTNKNQLHDSVVQLLGEHFCHNTTASVSFNEKKETFTGSRTEIALLKLAKEWGYDYEKKRNLKDIAAQVPFNSKIKRMETVVTIDGEHYVFVKGASEVILELATRYIDKEGNVHHLNHEIRKELYETVISNYANRAYRTLALAHKKIENLHDYVVGDEPILEKIEEDLILTGIFGIQDPIRPGVPEAVRTCQEAGITVRMVTGDNRDTAVAIARNCGIIDKGYYYVPGDDVVLLGEEFRARVKGLKPSPTDPKDFVVGDLEELQKITKSLRVLARSSPEDKYILVTGLRQLNEVVAVTGDGSNDAPALKKSNVGFAMHIAGTQLAQEASDIILLDDNFASIITAVLWGRNIYDSISKFIQFQLTVNIVALVMSFTGAVILQESPITAVQMLWVNLIMDTFAALALATEPPNDNLLKRQPVKHDDSLLTVDMFKTIVGQATYQLTWLLIILFGLPYIEAFDSINGNDLEYSYTIFFQTFVMMQVFIQINCRKLKSSEINVFEGFFNNPLFLGIIFITIIGQFLFVEVGGSVLKCSSLSLTQHLFCAFVGVGALIFGIFFRLVPTRWFTCFHFKEEAKAAGGFTEIVRKKTTRRAPTKHN